jgi:hypothetical protein
MEARVWTYPWDIVDEDEGPDAVELFTAAIATAG